MIQGEHGRNANADRQLSPEQPHEKLTMKKLANLVMQMEINEAKKRGMELKMERSVQKTDVESYGWKKEI